MFDVNKIREDFPILKRKINGHDLVFLDSGATSQKPESVLKAMDDFFLKGTRITRRFSLDPSRP